jgi:predicted nucleic acid-binding protein
MKATFVDTFYYLALVNSDDSGRAKAMAASQNRQGRLVTTEWVMVEVADALADPVERPKFLAILDAIGSDASVSLVEADDALFRRAVELYRHRPDKEWSLTDCESFVVMDEQGIREALTADAHFEQAGFIALLKD